MTRLLRISIFFSTIFFAIPSSAMMKEPEIYQQLVRLEETRQCLMLDLNIDATIGDLKTIIFNQVKIPVEEQNIVMGNVYLKDNKIITEIPEDHRAPLRLVRRPQIDIRKDSTPSLIGAATPQNKQFNAAFMNLVREKNQQDSSLQSRFAAWASQQIEPQIDTLAELRNQFENDLQNGAYDMARAAIDAVLNSHRYTMSQKNEAYSWLQKLAQIESQINDLMPMYNQFKDYVQTNNFLMAHAVVDFIINDDQCTQLQKEKARSWLLEINGTESQTDMPVFMEETDEQSANQTGFCLPEEENIEFQANALTEIRIAFWKHLQNKDYKTARETANSVLGSCRYTTLQKDEARSWLQEVDQIDPLIEIRINFDNCERNGDRDIARAIAKSVLCSSRYTEDQKAEVRSWFLKR